MTSLDDVQEDITQHREELAATVDALAAKLDVRTRLRAKVADQVSVLRRHTVPITGGAAVVALVLVARRSRRP